MSATASPVRERGFSLVDVFAPEPLKGNGLAVVHDGTDLDDTRLQAFARWTQQSETTFLLPPTDPAADYRVRIFTPGGELPFAGHPTLGTAHVWLANGGQPKTRGVVVQQCAAGLVPVRTGDRPAFRAPPTSVERVDGEVVERARMALKLPPGAISASAWLSNGFPQLVLVLEDAATVLSLKPDHAAIKALAKIGVVGAHPAGSECAFEMRFFAAPIDITEDPVTGSLQANLAQWMIDTGRAPSRYVAAQGTALGRAGRVHVERDAEGTWIGGDVSPCVRGTVTL